MVVLGKISGQPVHLDLKTIVDVFEWYVKDAPRDTRTLEKFLKVTKTYEEIRTLLKLEARASVSYIEGKLDDVVARRELDTEEDIV